MQPKLAWYFPRGLTRRCDSDDEAAARRPRSDGEYDCSPEGDEQSRILTEARDEDHHEEND